jgi:F-type H+-transporting ATPase subunit delta
VTHRTAATRYARALLDVALKEQADLSRIESQLADFVALLAQHRDLEKALLNPAVPAPRKRAAVVELTSQGHVLPILGKLLILLAERDRLVLLPDVLNAYRERLLRHQNVVRAEVTTAAPLAAERTREIEQSLARATGRTVQLSTRVDPAIVGGIVTRIGSTVYDGSITNHLRRMKLRLLSEVRGG